MPGIEYTISGTAVAEGRSHHRVYRLGATVAGVRSILGRSPRKFQKVHPHLALALCKPGENRSDLEARITEGRQGNNK
jgi:hypothetical protein